MSVEWGFESPIWMAKVIVQDANERLLKLAVMQVIDHLNQASQTGEGSSPFEILDRLVQVIATGQYTAQKTREEEVARKVINLGPEGLTHEQEKEIQDFIKELNDLPTSDEDDESYEDFLKRLGIPDLDDFRKDDDDDDPQPE